MVEHKHLRDGRRSGLAMQRRTVAALATFIAATLQAAVADTLPSYASADQATQIHGSVMSINRRDLTLRDDRGFLDHVVLLDGTVINPTGIEIEPGQLLTIYGHADGDAFSASEIDTASAPYAPVVADPVDAYVPYYDPYFDPYFGYGYGYGYGFGAFGGTSLFFGFGDRFGGRGFSGHGVGGRGFGERGFDAHGSGGRGFGGGGHGGGRGR